VCWATIILFHKFLHSLYLVNHQNKKYTNTNLPRKTIIIIFFVFLLQTFKIFFFLSLYSSSHLLIHLFSFRFLFSYILSLILYLPLLLLLSLHPKKYFYTHFILYNFFFFPPNILVFIYENFSYFSRFYSFYLFCYFHREKY
jgi:hypothetical protein